MGVENLGVDVMRQFDLGGFGTLINSVYFQYLHSVSWIYTDVLESDTGLLVSNDKLGNRCHKCCSRYSYTSGTLF